MAMTLGFDELMRQQRDATLAASAAYSAKQAQAVTSASGEGLGSTPKPPDIQQTSAGGLGSTPKPPDIQQTSAGGLGSTPPGPTNQPSQGFTDAYTAGTAVGKSWDQNTGQWVATTGTPDLAQDSDGSYWYKGKKLSPQEFQELYFQGPQQVQMNNVQLGTKPAMYAAPTISGAGMQAQGFTPTGASATAGQAAAPPSINAPQVKAEQGGFSDFNALEKSMFESQFRPVARELDRSLSVDEQRLKAQLAQSGIADSGAGVQQLSQQTQAYLRQKQGAAEDAANRASVQRYGMEYTQSMDNARLRQEANLANAGFSLTAQVENARNILTANITNAQLSTQASIASAANATQASIAGAQNQTQASIASADNATRTGIANASLQMQTLGLNQQAVESSRRDFLQLLGIQAQELARMDAFDLENTSLFYNSYLKQLAVIASIGTASVGKGDSSSNTLGIDAKIGGGVGVGGE